MVLFHFSQGLLAELPQQPVNFVRVLDRIFQSVVLSDPLKNSLDGDDSGRSDFDLVAAAVRDVLTGVDFCRQSLVVL